MGGRRQDLSRRQNRLLAHVGMGRRNQCPEEVALVAVIHQQLRVPLHADEEWAITIFDALDDVLLIMRGGCEIARQPVDCLVVDRIDEHPRVFDEPRQLRAWHQFYAQPRHYGTAVGPPELLVNVVM